MTGRNGLASRQCSNITAWTSYLSVSAGRLSSALFTRIASSRPACTGSITLSPVKHALLVVWLLRLSWLKRGWTLPKLATGARKRLEAATAYYERSLSLATKFLDSRGLDAQLARAHRLGVVERPCSGHENYTGRLSIPYITRAGIATIRFRCLLGHDCKAAGCAKYLGLCGARPTLFNVQAFFTPSPDIAITEGEFDAMVVNEYAGVPAVGVQGVSAWSDTWTRLFSDYERVLIVGDGDEAGRGMAERLNASIPNSVSVGLPDGMDCNDILVTQGAEALRAALGVQR